MVSYVFIPYLSYETARIYQTAVNMAAGEMPAGKGALFRQATG
jgi:hypothetical protein